MENINITDETARNNFLKSVGATEQLVVLEHRISGNLTALLLAATQGDTILLSNGDHSEWAIVPGGVVTYYDDEYWFNHTQQLLFPLGAPRRSLEIYGHPHGLLRTVVLDDTIEYWLNNKLILTKLSADIAETYCNVHSGLFIYLEDGTVVKVSAEGIETNIGNIGFGKDVCVCANGVVVWFADSREFRYFSSTYPEGWRIVAMRGDVEIDNFQIYKDTLGIQVDDTFERHLISGGLVTVLDRLIRKYVKSWTLCDHGLVTLTDENSDSRIYLNDSSDPIWRDDRNDASNTNIEVSHNGTDIIISDSDDRLILLVI